LTLEYFLVSPSACGGGNSKIILISKSFLSHFPELNSPAARRGGVIFENLN